jgi:hypothetical protein
MGRSRSGGVAAEAVKAGGRADCVGRDLASRGFLSLYLPGGLRRRRIRSGGGGAGEHDAEEECDAEEGAELESTTRGGGGWQPWLCFVFPYSGVDKAGKEEAAVEACGWVGSNGLEVGFGLVRVLCTKETRLEPSDPRSTAVNSWAIWATWASLLIIFLFLFSFCCTIVK